MQRALPPQMSCGRLFSCARAVVNTAPFDGSETPDIVWAPAKNNNGVRPKPLRIRLDPGTLTYSLIEPLDVEAWLEDVKAAAKLTKRRTAAKFDDEAVLKLAARPLSKSELHAAVRDMLVTERDTRAGLNRLLNSGRLVEQKAGCRNTKLVGTPESFLNLTNPTLVLSGLSE